MRRNTIIIFAVLALVFASTAVLASGGGMGGSDAANPTLYHNYYWDETTNKVVDNPKPIDDAIEFNDETKIEDGGVYILKEDTDLDGRYFGSASGSCTIIVGGNHELKIYGLPSYMGSDWTVRLCGLVDDDWPKVQTDDNRLSGGDCNLELHGIDLIVNGKVSLKSLTLFDGSISTSNPDKIYSDSSAVLEVEEMYVYGGTVKIELTERNGYDRVGIESDNLEVYGGELTIDNKYPDGSSISRVTNVKIYGGTFNSYSDCVGSGLDIYGGDVYLKLKMSSESNTTNRVYGGNITIECADPSMTVHKYQFASYYGDAFTHVIFHNARSGFNDDFKGILYTENTENDETEVKVSDNDIEFGTKMNGVPYIPYTVKLPDIDDVELSINTLKLNEGMTLENNVKLKLQNLEIGEGGVLDNKNLITFIEDCKITGEGSITGPGRDGSDSNLVFSDIPEESAVLNNTKGNDISCPMSLALSLKEDGDPAESLTFGSNAVVEVDLAPPSSLKYAWEHAVKIDDEHWTSNPYIYVYINVGLGSQVDVGHEAPYVYELHGPNDWSHSGFDVGTVSVSASVESGMSDFDVSGLSTTFEVKAADMVITPTYEDLEYKAEAQNLISGITQTVDGYDVTADVTYYVGSVKDENPPEGAEYTKSCTGVEAGWYRVWYKVVPDPGLYRNNINTGTGSVVVEIKPMDLEKLGPVHIEDQPYKVTAYMEDDVMDLVHLSNNGHELGSEDFGFGSFAAEGDRKSVGSTVTFTVNGTGTNYTGTLGLSFNIVPAELKESMFQVVSPTYIGSALEPNVSGSFPYGEGQSYDLKSSDFTVVSYENNINAGDDAKVVVKGTGNFSDKEVTITFTILPKSLKGDGVVFATIPGQEYTGKQITPSVSFTYNGTSYNSGFDTEYGTNKNVSDNGDNGQNYVTVKGSGNFKDEVTIRFEITARSIAQDIDTPAAGFTFTADSVEYTGSQITPDKVKVSGTYNGTITITEGFGIAVLDNGYGTNTNVLDEDNYVTIEGEGNFSGELKVPLTITAKSISEGNDSFTFTINPVPYTGGQIKPSLYEAKFGGTNLKVGKDYEIQSYGTNQNVADNSSSGNNYVTIKGTGNFSGTRTVHFEITKSELNGDISISEKSPDGHYRYKDTLTAGYSGDSAFADKDYVQFKWFVSNKDGSWTLVKGPGVDGSELFIEGTYIGCKVKVVVEPGDSNHSGSLVNYLGNDGEATATGPDVGTASDKVIEPALMHDVGGEGKNTTYTGQPIWLTSEPSFTVEDGNFTTVYYKITKENHQPDLNSIVTTSDALEKPKDCDTYYVWYKIVDQNGYYEPYHDSLIIDIGQAPLNGDITLSISEKGSTEVDGNTHYRYLDILEAAYSDGTIAEGDSVKFSWYVSNQEGGWTLVEGPGVDGNKLSIDGTYIGCKVKVVVTPGDGNHSGSRVNYLGNGGDKTDTGDESENVSNVFIEPALMKVTGGEFESDAKYNGGTHWFTTELSPNVVQNDETTIHYLVTTDSNTKFTEDDFTVPEDELEKPRDHGHYYVWYMIKDENGYYETCISYKELEVGKASMADVELKMTEVLHYKGTAYTEQDVKDHLEATFVKGSYNEDISMDKLRIEFTSENLTDHGTVYFRVSPVEDSNFEDYKDSSFVIEAATLTGHVVISGGDGKYVMGTELTAVYDSSDSTVSWRWYRVDPDTGKSTLIETATTGSYTIQPEDIGMTLKAVAVAHDAKNDHVGSVYNYLGLPEDNSLPDGMHDDDVPENAAVVGYLTITYTPGSPEEYTYDGESHGIAVLPKVTDSSGAVIEYSASTGESQPTEFGQSSPSLQTEAGTYTIWYRISATGYGTVVGHLTLTIHPKLIEGELTVQGGLTVGDAATAVYEPVDPEDVTVQWYVGGYPVDGATEWTYTITSSDVGKAVMAVVSPEDTRNYTGCYWAYVDGESGFSPDPAPMPGGEGGDGGSGDGSGDGSVTGPWFPGYEDGSTPPVVSAPAPEYPYPGYPGGWDDDIVIPPTVGEQTSEPRGDDTTMLCFAACAVFAALVLVFLWYDRSSRN